MSWWWIVGVMVFAFIWFEFIEKMLGLDKKKAHNVDEQRRKDRVKQAFAKTQIVNIGVRPSGLTPMLAC